MMHKKLAIGHGEHTMREQDRLIAGEPTLPQVTHISLEDVDKPRALTRLLSVWTIFTRLPARIRRWYTGAHPGLLSWQILALLAIKNLRVTRSRTLVTILSIAIGIGSIVFLLSFAYGLQEIVTQRIVRPYSFRLADVSSDSTALSLNPQSLEQIRTIGAITDIVPVVSLAGSLQLGESRTDVVVVSVQNKYFEYEGVTPQIGTFFSPEAEKRVGIGQTHFEDLTSLVSENAEIVLGMSSQAVDMKQEIDGLRRAFRVYDDTYIPVRAAPTLSSHIIGYVRGSIIETHTGIEVWGGTYPSQDTSGKNMLDGQGTWWGRWLRTTVPLYQEVAPTVYVPLTSSEGSPVTEEGFIAETSLSLMSPHDASIANDVEELLEIQMEKVLGEATTSAPQDDAASASAQVVVAHDASASAGLEQLIKEEQKVEEVPQVAVVSVLKDGGKEIVVTTGLLKTWNKDPADAVGHSVTLSYIVSGGVIPGMVGRVLSTPTEYTIAGVVDDDAQPLVYVPLAEVESMGVTKYSLLKILSAEEESLPSIREKIESMGYSTRSVVDTLVQVNRLFGVMRFLLGAFGLIALIVALFGMFNTMTVSLLERTREIGVMKTLGTTDHDVTRIFMVESAIVGIVGGVIGIIGGITFGWCVSLVLYALRGGGGIRLFSAPFGLIGGMIVVSIFVGLLTGIYPARRARTVSALDALRYE